MNRFLTIIFLGIFGTSYILSQGGKNPETKKSGINFGIGPGLYITPFLDRNESGTEPYESIKVSSEGQTTISCNGIVFSKLPYLTIFQYSLKLVLYH